MMASLGATPDMFVLRVNDRNLLTSALTDVAGVSADHLSQVFALVDRWEKYPREKLAESAAEVGLSDKQFDKLGETLDAGEALLDELPAEVREQSNLVRVLNSSAGSLVKYEPMIVRGLAYYTSTVFEVFDTSPENRRALFGGGRYSDLASMFTPQQIPGIGFGMGDVTLIDFLDTHGLTPAPRTAREALAIAACSPDGREREATIWRLAVSPDPEAVALLLIRCVDWAGPVRDAARKAVVSKLDDAALRAMLPLIGVLSRRQVDDWMTTLFRETLPGLLDTALALGDRESRRFAHREALGLLSRERLLEIASTDSDFVV